ncbi:tetratricopeptide repeat protein [Emcibacter sp.]|uniref:tetratricopeptide repeat protein n=1 Tax=Emcibacter sp. TaxID=1979954 RepID=UPI002AA90C3D|nr:tetratricopeptide repeat protein [Emcibacter sp.]
MRRAFFYLVFIFLSFLHAHSLSAQNAETALQKGMQAFNTRDYVTAVKYLYPEAQKGHTVAQELLSQFYAFGNGVPQDWEESAFWATIKKNSGSKDFDLSAYMAETKEKYKQQASDGDPAAMFRLGQIYFEGRGVAADPIAALNWFQKAADAGHGFAQFQLGKIYFEGRGVPKDLEKAYHFMEAAAQNGVTLAKHTQADFLLSGVIGKQNPHQAMILYLDAADDGYALSQCVWAMLNAKEADTREKRIEVMKWMYLSARLVDKPLAEKMVNVVTNTVVNNSDKSEISEAQQRARAFVRR